MQESTRHLDYSWCPSSDILENAWNNAGTTNGTLHSLSTSLSIRSAWRRCVLSCCNSISSSISRASISCGEGAVSSFFGWGTPRRISSSDIPFSQCFKVVSWLRTFDSSSDSLLIVPLSPGGRGPVGVELLLIPGDPGRGLGDPGNGLV